MRISIFSPVLEYEAVYWLLYVYGAEDLDILRLLHLYNVDKVPDGHV